jgi:hypothetical protein
MRRYLLALLDSPMVILVAHQILRIAIEYAQQMQLEMVRILAQEHS